MLSKSHDLENRSGASGATRPGRTMSGTGARPAITSVAPRPTVTAQRPLAAAASPHPKPANLPQRPVRPEPTYHPVGSLAAKGREDEAETWR